MVRTGGVVASGAAGANGARTTSATAATRTTESGFGIVSSVLTRRRHAHRVADESSETVQELWPGGARRCAGGARPPRPVRAPVRGPARARDVPRRHRDRSLVAALGTQRVGDGGACLPECV